MAKDKIPWDEFEKRMERFDDVELRVIEERLSANYKREKLEFLTDQEAETLKAILDRALPLDQDERDIDLTNFMDWAIPKPLGYGDKQEGMPDDLVVFHEGLKGIEELSSQMFDGRKFSKLEDDEKDRIIKFVQEGRGQGGAWENVPSKVFFRKLMLKAIAGYCAHPKIWARIGFYGPSYPDGYIWITQREVQVRHDKKSENFTF